MGTKDAQIPTAFVLIPAYLRRPMVPTCPADIPGSSKRARKLEEDRSKIEVEENRKWDIG